MELDFTVSVTDSLLPMTQRSKNIRTFSNKIFTKSKPSSKIEFYHMNKGSIRVRFHEENGVGESRANVFQVNFGKYR